MILIAEAGANKTDWRLIREDQVTQYRTEGFNPATHPGEEFISQLSSSFSEIRQGSGILYYYGAGLATEELKDLPRQALKKVFPQMDIRLDTDVLGAARSLFGEESGMVGILGTGSALCYYDGAVIADRIPSLGYILGDEGSAVDLGKKVVSAFLRDLLPTGLNRLFQESFNYLDEKKILEETYRGGKANIFLSSIGAFAIEHQKDPYIQQLIMASLHHYFEAYLGPSDRYQAEKFRFTGSVAYLLNGMLRKVARERGLHLDLISQSPISGLTLYHQTYG